MNEPTPMSHERASRVPVRALARACGVLALLTGVISIAGCLDKPGIEERWTRIDWVQSNVAANQVLTAGVSQPISVSATITYRAVITGFAVAELRVGDSVSVAANVVQPDAPRLAMAQTIDEILAHSTSLGRSTRAVTGWDHLIQPLDLSFTAGAPAAGQHLFLICYMGSGERVELPSGGDSIVVTPFRSADREILPVGMGLYTSGGGTP